MIAKQIMKRLEIVFLILTLILTFVLHSCSLDESDNYNNNEYPFALASVNVIEGKDYFFKMDNEKTIFPSDTTAIQNYKIVNGQRVYVWFDLLDEKISEYDYNARIVYIRDILTKGVFPITTAEQDSIGDDPVNIDYIGFGGGYLNVQFQLKGTNNPSKPHMINLVKNEMRTGEEEDGYINLEFRHIAKDDYQSEVYSGIVCFKPPFAEDETTKKGLKIRVNTMYEGVKYIKIDFDSSNNSARNEQSVSANTIAII